MEDLGNDDSFEQSHQTLTAISKQAFWESHRGKLGKGFCKQPAECVSAWLVME